MAVSWTILQDGTYQTFASLNLGNVRRMLVDQGVDKVMFDAPGAAFDGAALWSYGESVTIKRDNAVWFVGRVNNIPRLGVCTRQIDYEVVDTHPTDNWTNLATDIHDALLA